MVTVNCTGMTDEDNGCGKTRTLIYTANNVCGTAICVQTIRWTVDTNKPAITCPAPVSVQCFGDIPAPDLGAVAATDGCSIPTKSFVSDSYRTNGCVIIVTRTYKATDACGNSSTYIQTITVGDTTKPVITSVPTGGDLGCTPSTLPTDASVKALVIATDNCGSPVINVAHVLGGNTCSSNLTFTITAIDGCNNVSDARTVVYTFGCAPCVLSTFNLQGNSALSGTNGNVRLFSTNGISVKATAFSRVKSGGSWATAYLGSYGGGLGVTDTSEGDGSGNRHTVDNIDRDNYVLFEFSEPIVLSRATLGYVVSDSDLSLWIGTFADPYNSHLTLSDSVLASFGYKEDNLTDSATTRTANLNPGGVMGNAIVIAAWPGDTTPGDQFKIAWLDFCKRACPSPSPCSASICGSVVRDCDASGNLSGDAGISNVAVTLKKNGATVASTVTGANGDYCFGNLVAATYTVVVTPPTNYTLTSPSGCNHQQTVTLTNCQSKTGIAFGYTGTSPGIYFKKTGPATAVCGQTITYTFAVTNTGNTCFYGGMHVDDPMLGGRIFHQTPVSPGQGFSFTSNYVVKATDPTSLVNTATATGHPPTGNAVSAQSSCTVKVTPSTNALPSPWMTRDIGSVAATGNASYSAGKFTVIGSGADIGDAADEFRYVYRPVTGNFTIVTRVATIQNTDAWAKAGIMVRESLDAGSKNGGLFVTPGSVVAQSRNITGGATYYGTLASSTAPYWIKIVRSGNTFTGYYSANGTTWSGTRSQTLTTLSTMYIGLAITSHKDGVLCTATFDNVAVTP